MSKNKILIVSDYLFDELFGGCARVSTMLSKSLSFKYEVKLFLRGIKNSPKREFINNVEIFRHYGNVFLAIKNLKIIFEKKDIRVVNYHDPLNSFFVFLFLKLNRIKVPQIYTFHSPWSEEYKIRAKKKGYSRIRISICSYLRKLAERMALSSCDKIITESDYMNEILFKIHAIKSEAIYLGVDTVKFSPCSLEEKLRLRKEYKLPLDKKIFFTLRNLEPRMGFENLINSVKILKNLGHKNLFFIIGGGGSMELELKKQALEMDLSNEVLFTGKIPDEEIVSYYRLSDAFILPTKELEGFGLVSAEAMSSGIVVLATPVSANIKVIGDLDKSLLFKGIDSADIAKGIIAFLNRKDLEQLGEKARKYVESNFSQSKYIEKLENIFYEMSYMR
jgi:glycosyltransferase involved in cell wall biosynthesis